MRPARVPDQVVRLAVVFAVLALVLVAARHLFVPPTFGKLGHYRAAAVDSVAALPIHYAGQQACSECHPEEAETKNRSFHRGLSCEVCHRASGGHAADPSSAAPIKPTERGACLYCHDYLDSRPTGFPQIIESLHNPMKPCVGCHNPHDPSPPHVPSSCGACHASIVRTKAVSRHASLECETCHQTPAEHRQDPRAFPPHKPATREFCGQCHAEGAPSAAGIPRIDLATHGGRYICWQCHYPHKPEIR